MLHRRTQSQPSSLNGVGCAAGSAGGERSGGELLSYPASEEGEGNGESARWPYSSFGRAVVAYAQGNHALAVSHLKMAERDAEDGHAPIDARHAALRGALAARAGNWTDCYGWYVRSLSPCGAVDAQLPGSAGSCFFDDCASPALHRCGQCGRRFCPEHGAESKNSVARCGPCLDVAVHNLVQAAILTDHVEDAVETLTPWAGTTNSAATQTLLACLVPSHTGGFGEQAGALEAFAPDHREALLLYRASATLADLDLERVTAPSSDTADLSWRATYEWLRPWKARSLTRTGQYSEAWKVRHQDWLANPVDITVVHALAVAALRAFADGGEEDDRNRLMAARQAIACWAVVLHSTSYWQELERRSGHPWTSDERKNASAVVAERIRQALRDDDRAADRPVAAGLELAWDVENAAARALSDVVATAGSEWPLQTGGGLSFGPGFLGLLQSAGASWKTAAEEIHRRVSETDCPADLAGERLRDLMSPEGRYAMLLETGRFDHVIKELELSTVGAGGTGGERVPSHGLCRILGAALTARAREHLRFQRWSAALRDFENAAATGVSLTPHEKEIGEAGVKAGLALIRNRTDDADWQAYAGLLGRALELVPQDKALKENLAAACVHLGEHARTQGDRDTARARFAQAHELDPANHAAAAALNEADTRWAETLLERKPSSGLVRAITVLRGVLGRDAMFRPARKALATALYERSLDVALTGARGEAMELMKESQGLLEPNEDEWTAGRGPKEDIANGLCGRTFPVDVSDEDDLRDALDVLAVARTYATSPELTGEQVALLAHLVELLCRNEDYDGAVQLVRRCPRDARNRNVLDSALAEAYAGRARRRLAEGDTAAAHSDIQAVCRYDPMHPLVLFGPGDADQLW